MAHEVFLESSINDTEISERDSDILARLDGEIEGYLGKTAFETLASEIEMLDQAKKNYRATKIKRTEHKRTDGTIYYIDDAGDTIEVK